MQQYLEHPTEEALERFLLNQSHEEELEVLETHILACDSCITRLETLETQVTAIKTALKDLPEDSPDRQVSNEGRSWRSWFTIPRLAWAGAAAGLTVCLALSTPVQINLSPERSAKTFVVPEWRPLHVHLNTADLTDGPVSAQLVTGQGAEIWRASSAVKAEQAELNLPRLTKPGNYFLRLYSPSKGSQDGTLLREFAFQVK